QRPGAVPGHEGRDALVQLVGQRAMQVEIMLDAPAQVGVGVFVREPHHAAAAQQRRYKNYKEPLHQKLSTVMCPGARRRCLRMPRAASAACASFSMSGLPQSMTCEVSAS